MIYISNKLMLHYIAQWYGILFYLDVTACHEYFTALSNASTWVKPIK